MMKSSCLFSRMNVDGLVFDLNASSRSLRRPIVALVGADDLEAGLDMVDIGAEKNLGNTMAS